MNDEQLGKLLVNITTISNKLSNEEFLKSLTGDILSYTAVKLAAMKASVVDFKVVAHEDMLEKEVLLGKAKAIAYAKYRDEVGATAAQDMKYMDEDFMQAQRDYNKSKVLYEQLKSIVADTHDLIDSIKSRVIDLQGQQRNER